MGGDLADIHFYPGPRMGPPMAGMARVTGEHGSFGSCVEGHVWDDLLSVGRGLGRAGLSPTELVAAYRASAEEQVALEVQGLSGSQYFQLTDVEQEHQGLVTYDRQVVKIPLAEIRKINALLAPTKLDLDKFVRDFEIQEVDPEPAASRTRRAVADHIRGASDMSALRRLPLAAVRLGLPDAHAIVAEFIDRSPKPHTNATWRFILATASSSADQSFAALRGSAAEACAALGEDSVMSKLVAIVSAEELPDTSTPNDIDREALRRVVEQKYPELAPEVIDGARMMAARSNCDWPQFGTYYERYYRVATMRSRYPFVLLTADVFEHVVDPTVLNRAIDSTQRHLNTVVEDLTLRRGDPIMLDVYANLLYKVGRTQEALVWQESAVRISHGRSREIEDHYRKMIYGRQTWRQD